LPKTSAKKYLNKIVEKYVLRVERNIKKILIGQA